MTLNPPAALGAIVLALCSAGFCATAVAAPEGQRGDGASSEGARAANMKAERPRAERQPRPVVQHGDAGAGSGSGVEARAARGDGGRAQGARTQRPATPPPVVQYGDAGAGSGSGAEARAARGDGGRSASNRADSRRDGSWRAGQVTVAPPAAVADRHYRGPVTAPVPGAARWYDTAHGHRHYYPAPGYSVRTLPPRSRVVFWSGINYGFYDGIWYAPGGLGYSVVRPPLGIVVSLLPPYRTVVTFGGIGYYYANGAYYRPLGDDTYQVVAPPDEVGAVVANDGGQPTSDSRMYVYPRLGQSAEKQASDEYECHRWAVSQTGFDPTAVATGTAGNNISRRDEYRRANSACLDGRGYTVR